MTRSEPSGRRRRDGAGADSDAIGAEGAERARPGDPQPNDLARCRYSVGDTP